jgi:hypothetical protein
MKMDHLRNPRADGVAQARARLAAAARSVNKLESAAEEAMYRLAALTGMLCRLEDLTGPRDTEAAAAARDAAAVCRDAHVLLRSLDALDKRLAVVTVVVHQSVATPSAG